MNDEGIRRAFDRLEEPLEPSPGFADDLFERLQREAGRRPGRKRPVSPRPRVRRTLAIAATFTVAVVVVTLVLVPLARLGDRDKPISLGPFPSLPAFSLVLERHVPPESVAQIAAQVAEERGEAAPTGPFTEDVVRYRLSYDGSDRWRIDYLDESARENFPRGYGLLVLPPGSFELFDGERLWEYDAGTNTYSKSDVHHRPMPFAVWDATDDASRFWEDRCEATPTFVGVGSVAGIETRHVRCGRFQLWVDPGTGLIVRQWLDSPWDPAHGYPLPYLPGIVFGETQVAAELQYDPPFSDDTFSFVPPEGSLSAGERYDRTPPTSLTIGQPVPDIELPLLDGGTFNLSAIRGKPTALWFWADWCEPCIGTPLEAFDAASLERADELNLVSIATNTDVGTTRRYVENHGYTVPVALDGEGTVANDVVEAKGIPLLLLIDEDGLLVGAYVGWDGQGTAADVDAVLDALAAGRTTLPDIPGVEEQS